MYCLPLMLEEGEVQVVEVEEGGGGWKEIYVPLYLDCTIKLRPPFGKSMRAAPPRHLLLPPITGAATTSRTRTHTL